MNNKIPDLIEAMKNPPPLRLATIEYKSHFMQMIGISFASIFLIWKGFWYIIPAFIFGIGISYSQGMSSYRKYQVIKEFTKPENPKNYEKDISWTRRRSKIIGHVYGDKSAWMSSFIAVITPALIYDINSSRWFLMIVFPITMAITYFIFHFYILYWISYRIYKEDILEAKDKK